MPAEPKLTAEERVRAVTHDMFELLLVHNNDAIRIAEEHAAAAVEEITAERDEARERITALGRKLSETYAIRSALDCVYAGPYMEPDAGTKSHCPPDKPCQRCLLERERDGLVKASAGFIRAWEQAERERDDARAEVEWLRANNSDLRLRNAELVDQALAEHRAEIEAADGGEGER